MNISKHMEAIFVAVLAVASLTGVATASRPAAPVSVPAVSAQQEAPMQVVTISAKRLTAAEKAAAQ